jgi:hypothetical protein
MKRLALTVLLCTLGFTFGGCAGSGGKHAKTGTSAVKTAAAKSQVEPSRRHDGSARSPLVVALGYQAVAGVNLLKGARFLSPTRLAVVTVGSGSCPAVPKRLGVQSPDAIRIHLTRDTPPNGACTDDLRTTPVVIAINPKQINVHHRLTVRLYYYGSSHPIVRVAPPPL